MRDTVAGEILRSGDLEVRPSEFLVYVRGRVLNFTRREQQVLAVMMRSEGRILSRDELYALVWGRKLKPGDRTIDVYVRRLRSRLAEALPDSTFIHTHFGFGYRYSPEPHATHTVESRLVNHLPTGAATLPAQTIKGESPL